MRRTGDLAIGGVLLFSVVVHPTSAMGNPQLTPIAEVTAASIVGQRFAAATSMELSNPAAAIRIYLALAQDPRVEVRNEARFRHAQLLARLGQPFPAIALYRAILDEQPDMPRVRVELASLLAAVGDRRGAERELTAARKAALPPEVASAIDQFSVALRDARPFGASFEVALAPSTNINRATTSTTLDTVIAPFTLSKDARAQSGTGLRVGAQGRARLHMTSRTQFAGRISAQGSFYRQQAFDDLVASAEVGIVRSIGKVEARPLIGRSYRWFGGAPYATTDTLTTALSRPLGAAAQVSGTLGYGRARYEKNDLQNGDIITADILYERALSARLGGGVGFSYERQGAADPGYATTSNGLQLLAWRRIGDTSVFVDARTSMLTADARLGLFPQRREDRRYSGTIGVTLPRFKVRAFTPIVRLSYESNASSVGLYDYDRWGGDIGFSRAF